MKIYLNTSRNELGHNQNLSCKMHNTLSYGRCNNVSRNANQVVHQLAFHDLTSIRKVLIVFLCSSYKYGRVRVYLHRSRSRVGPILTFRSVGPRFQAHGLSWSVVRQAIDICWILFSFMRTVWPDPLSNMGQTQSNLYIQSVCIGQVRSSGSYLHLQSMFLVDYVMVNLVD